jgi:uncharacterized repeat protein (TIGR03803 family)
MSIMWSQPAIFNVLDPWYFDRTTSIGGTYDGGTVFSVKLGGRDERSLHDFGNAPDGNNPVARGCAAGTERRGSERTLLIRSAFEEI